MRTEVLNRKNLTFRNIYSSMVMDLEFHSDAGEIQYVFAPKWIPSKDFLSSVRELEAKPSKIGQSFKK